MGDIEGILAILGVFGPVLIASSGLTYYLVKKGLAKAMDSETQEQMVNLNRRVSDLESRLNDLQDILITVDEKLGRASNE
jgi:hypothetical protein